MPAIKESKHRDMNISEAHLFYGLGQRFKSEDPEYVQTGRISFTKLAGHALVWERVTNEWNKPPDHMIGASTFKVPKIN